MALFNITLKSITSFISDSLCNIFTKVIHQPLAEYTFACGKVPAPCFGLRQTKNNLKILKEHLLDKVRLKV